MADTTFTFDTRTDVITGTVVGDPHIETFRGDKFDFMGEHERWYCFLSAKCVQVNVKMRTFEEKTPTWSMLAS